MYRWARPILLVSLLWAKSRLQAIVMIMMLTLLVMVVKVLVMMLIASMMVE